MIVYDITKKLYLYYDSKICQILCLNLQLVVVETALLGDGENVDLLELRTNLKELIKLTEGKYILCISLASFYKIYVKCMCSEKFVQKSFVFNNNNFFICT